MEPAREAGDNAIAFARRLNVYGSMIVYKLMKSPAPERWAVDQDDEYANLPAHYLTAEEALDRVAFLRSRNIEARVAP